MTIYPKADKLYIFTYYVYSGFFTDLFIPKLIHFDEIITLCSAITKALCFHFTEGFHLTRTVGKTFGLQATFVFCDRKCSSTTLCLFSANHKKAAHSSQIYLSVWEVCRLSKRSSAIPCSALQTRTHPF